MRTLAAITLVLSPLAAQTIAVAGGGTALQSAVATAPSGAILVVSPGQYSNFTVVDKDLTIVAPSRATVGGQIASTNNTNGPHRLVRLVGLDVIPLPVGGFPGYQPGRIAADGHLIVENCTCNGIDIGLTGTGTTPTHLCHVMDTTIVANLTNTGTMTMVNTAAWFRDSTIAGGVGYSSSGGSSGYTAGPGLRAQFSSFRAERTTFLGASVNGVGAEAIGGGLFTSAFLANCTVQAGAGGTNAIYWPFGGSTTAHGTTFQGAVIPPVIPRLLVTADWQQRTWTPGGTSIITLTEGAHTAMATVLTTSPAWYVLPVVAEPLGVNLNDYYVLGLGITDAQGRYQQGLSIPNSPALAYATAWVTGICFDPLPLRSSVPIGGTIL